MHGREPIKPDPQCSNLVTCGQSWSYAMQAGTRAAWPAFLALLNINRSLASAVHLSQP